MENMMIPTAGLSQGPAFFEWKVGREFFRSFGNLEILDADLVVKASVMKDGRDVCVDCRLDGTLTVNCDRCLAPVAMEVSPSFAQRLCCGASTEDEFAQDIAQDGREIVAVDASESEYDLSQSVYDYACLSLPIQCVHKEGECDRETVARLCSGNPLAVDSAASDPVQDASSKPFSVLKGLF